jgi:NitT/TauT family transport system substrate-binding protein
MIRRAALILTILAVALQAAGAQTLVAWRHGNLQPKGDAGFFYMAAEGGFAKKQGLDLKMLAFQNDSLMFKALIAGEIDSYEGSPVSPMIAGAKGSDVKILGCSWPRLIYSIFARGDIASLADLKGKTLGISQPGALPDHVARILLQRHGLGAGEVKFVMSGTDADRIRALVAGAIDSAIATSEFGARKELGLKTLVRASDSLPEFMRICMITRADVVKTRADDLVRLMAAEIGALDYAVKNREAVLALARKIAALPAGDPAAEVVFEEAVVHGALSPTLEIPMAKLMWLRDLLAADGKLPASFDPARLVDASIRERALKQLAAQR